ncbi:PstS family phosphate ABC transporter substrate-binding protein [Flavobacterium sp. RHBU_3]|uniref:PstS family phosphate ABC transporter substrate-binding protein n=1 Tax=Flavobacterium sp. RHBU_3 TaxID=3391184 RepID=UPI00398529F3
MKKIILFGSIALAVSALVFVSCKQNEAQQETVAETMTSGNLSIQVDNTIQPIVEDVAAVFQSNYPKAKLTQVNRNEADIVRALLNNSATVAVLTRKLTPGEEGNFKQKGIKARTVAFAKDGIAFVASKSLKDTILNLQDIYKVLKGEDVPSVKQLIFDNAASSTTRYLFDKAGVTNVPEKKVYTLKNTAEVLTFVKNNPGSIGVIGVNWLVQPSDELEPLISQVQVLAVNNVKNGVPEKNYYKPSQSNIGAGLYPLTRTLYVLNYQGREGLGMGFANYITNPDGQRIVLKSGLLPEKIPFREIEIVNK